MANRVRFWRTECDYTNIIKRNDKRGFLYAIHIVITTSSTHMPHILPTKDSKFHRQIRRIIVCCRKCDRIVNNLITRFLSGDEGFIELFAPERARTNTITKTIFHAVKCLKKVKYRLNLHTDKFLFANPGI